MEAEQIVQAHREAERRKTDAEGVTQAHLDQVRFQGRDDRLTSLKGTAEGNWLMRQSQPRDARTAERRMEETHRSACGSRDRRMWTTIVFQIPTSFMAIFSDPEEDGDDDCFSNSREFGMAVFSDPEEDGDDNCFSNSHEFHGNFQ
eukprot:g20951.t1